jgi:hypothetical protein
MSVLEPEERRPGTGYVGRDSARLMRDGSGDASGDSDVDEMATKRQQARLDRLIRGLEVDLHFHAQRLRCRLRWFFANVVASTRTPVGMP